jgi:hypothetical protein
VADTGGVSSTALFAIEVAVILGALVWLWRLVWEFERTGGPRRLTRQRALIGSALLALLFPGRIAAWGYFNWL